MNFSESVAYQFRVGFTEVYRRFAAAGITDPATFIGSGKLGLSANAFVAVALGAGMVNVGREIMLSIGCIHAQRCHTDTCPTGTATQSTRLARSLDSSLKSQHAANYIKTLRRDLLKVPEAYGVAHPGLITADDLDILAAGTPLREVYGYDRGWGLPSSARPSRDHRVHARRISRRIRAAFSDSTLRA